MSKVHAEHPNAPASELRTRLTSPTAWTVASLVGPFALAAACIPLRSTIAQTNLAMLLVVTVVLASSGGRRLPGVLAAVSGGVGFDFFLTHPYYSLTIAGRNDFTTLLFLIAVGLIVGEISVRTRRARTTADIRADYLERIERIGRLATHSPAATVANAISSEICQVLPVASCRYERDPGSHRRLPIVEPDGTVLRPSGTWSVIERGFPDDVLEIPTHGPDGGRFLLVPLVGIPVDKEALRFALSLVDRFRLTPNGERAA